MCVVAGGDSSHFTYNTHIENESGIERAKKERASTDIYTYVIAARDRGASIFNLCTVDESPFRDWTRFSHGVCACVWLCDKLHRMNEWEIVDETKAKNDKKKTTTTAPVIVWPHTSINAIHPLTVEFRQLQFYETSQKHYCRSSPLSYLFTHSLTIHTQSYIYIYIKRQINARNGFQTTTTEIRENGNRSKIDTKIVYIWIKITLVIPL